MDRSRSQVGSASRPRLTIIIVNYESWPDVVRLVGDLRDEPEVRAGKCEVVVVDNASRGPIPAALRAGPPGIRLIARPDNGGFAVGVNAGWRAATSPWLLVLNPDIEITRGFLSRTFARLDHYESRAEAPAGIIGFGLLNPDGSPQGSVGAFPSLGRSIREQFIPRPRRKYQPAWRIRPGRVDWVTGACMLVNATLMHEVGGMDEDFFLYYEEVAFSRVAQQRGWRVEFDPSLLVVHRHPLQNRAISPKMRVITRHSKLLYFHKYLTGWQFRMMATIVRLEAAIRGGWSALRGRGEELRSWAVIGEVARRLLRGDAVRGGEVRGLAESVVRPQSPPAAKRDRAVRGASDSRHSADRPGRSRRPAWMRRRSRPGDGGPLRSRKEGSA